MNFGSEIRKMRKGAGMSQEALAEELYIARSSISKLERNQLELKAADFWAWMNVTQSQELVAAMALGIDVAILQQALDLIPAITSVAGMILLGGIA